VGTKRIGVAASDVQTRLPRPLTTLEAGQSTAQQLQTLVEQQGAIGLVIGLPRGLEGQETAQTQAVREFVEKLKSDIRLPYYWQDEAVTSRQAKAELQGRGKPYAKGDIDALSATYILEDFWRDHPDFRAQPQEAQA
jgi:putative Holliday junction resolvase